MNECICVYIYLESLVFWMIRNFTLITELYIKNGSVTSAEEIMHHLNPNLIYALMDLMRFHFHWENKSVIYCFDEWIQGRRKRRTAKGFIRKGSMSFGFFYYFKRSKNILLLEIEFEAYLSSYIQIYNILFKNKKHK